MWITKLFKIISCNEGWRKSILCLTRTDSLKMGKFVGKDILGNKYYENPYYFFGTNRWVIYSDRFGYDYDASQIHSSWYRWMHYVTDLKPYEECRTCYRWSLEHTENMSGTEHEYVPYSTTKRKIIPWIPNSNPCVLIKKYSEDP